MKNRPLSLFVLFASLFSQAATAHQRPEPASVRLTVSVFNDAAVPQSILAEARTRAGVILERAGVSLDWLDCGTPGDRPPTSGCSAIAFPRHLSVRLVSLPSGAGEDTFGHCFQNADGEGNYAVVYFGALAASRSTDVVHTGELLGLVIAHELGHLLLGLSSHSPTGLMSPVWKSAELRLAVQGNLFFTDEQQHRIRSRYLAAAARFKKVTKTLQAASGNEPRNR